MTRLPKEIVKDLNEEAKVWDKSIAGESAKAIERHLNGAEAFNIPRPPRRPVSIRLDPFDLSMVRRLARKKGIPPTQLMAAWLHERIEQEKRVIPN